MKNLIRQIRNLSDVTDIFEYVVDRLFKYGPVTTSDLEILSLLKLYHPKTFEKHNTAILNYMGVFYKNSEPKSLAEVVFRQYRKFIHDNYENHYTPVQASIIRGINANKCFSFSAPTSTGKSFVFLNQIEKTSKSVVIVVPSRALINEYFLKLTQLIPDKSINILTFIDNINTRHAKRNVFIVTPERCRELFKQKNNFDIGLFLFDEAQLSNELSKRGLYFDSIVRRSSRAFPDSKFVFAHPFVQNPESQIEKNNFEKESSQALRYKHKNVGQMFMCVDKNWNYFHFGIDKTLMGSQKIKCSFDPIKKIIKSGGSVLFYISKSKIYKKEFLQKFKKYNRLCKEIEPNIINPYLTELIDYTGGQIDSKKNRFSQLLALLKRGIVIHHGSLPLQIRIILEKFTQSGYCKLCFATSTLTQGINMPFDLVFLDRLDGSKPLSVKNIIGRAGRSTSNNKFDFGYVVLGAVSKMSKFRTIMQNEEILDNVSSLEKEDFISPDFNDFREAILNGTYSDEFNLTQKDLDKIETDEIENIVKSILDSVFRNNELITLNELNSNQSNKLALYDNFKKLYSSYLGRELERGESNVFDTAIKIMLWKVHGKTFKNICWYRYSYASKSNIRTSLIKSGKSDSQLEATFITEFKEIPDRELPVYSMFPPGTKAKNVDYDRIMFDTYDYIDKLLGFKLSDLFFASFKKYFDKTEDKRAEKLSKYVKFGTDNEKHIWMLRYGMSFEEIQKLESHIESIDETEIVFKNSINNLTDLEKSPVIRYIN